MGCVYKASNRINNMSYVGKTIRKLSRRKNQHIYQSKNYDKFFYNMNDYFHKALQIDGIENFEWTILFESNDNRVLLQKEKECIVTLKTGYPNGYNIKCRNSKIIINLPKHQSMKIEKPVLIRHVVYTNNNQNNYLMEIDNLLNDIQYIKGCNKIEIEQSYSILKRQGIQCEYKEYLNNYLNVLINTNSQHYK